jgi:enamine deaminase RidA (YjgF/YER057c/UK114 family)
MIIHTPDCSAAEARVVSLAGLLPSDSRQSRAAQARSVLERMEAALRREGMTFANVVRTWFHLDDILGWYGEFNSVRTAFFRERDVFGGMVPASTGVGLANSNGAAIVGGVLALDPRSAGVTVRAVPSPLQCQALDYHSAFSRAAEVQWPGQRHLYISGTASIDAAGASVRVGDLDGQIAWTMDVVDALLRSRQMTWRDVTPPAVAYFVNLEGARRLEAYCRSRNLLDLAVTPVRATMCRKELLFEIELDAVSSRGGPDSASLAS